MAQIAVGIVENLTDEALIVSKGYEEDLETLQAGGIINDASKHNLETLIISGVQSYNGVDVPGDYVKKAFEVLESEVKVLFSNDIKIPEVENVRQVHELQEDNDEEINVHENNTDSQYGYDDEPAFINKDGDVDFRIKEKIRNKKMHSGQSFDRRKVIKILAIVLPIILIIILAFVVRGLIKNNRDDIRNAVRYETTPTVEETEETTTETIPETTSEAGMYRVTGDRVWIRDQATTTSKRIAGVDKGNEVRVIKYYDKDWAIINWDGKEAFISRQYIVRKDDEEQNISMETTSN